MTTPPKSTYNGAAHAPQPAPHPDNGGVSSPSLPLGSLPQTGPASTSNAVTPPHHLADLYTYNWAAFNLRLPLVSASAVALCLVVGLALGHPGGALIAGGGAFTIGFGANQRIADSRIVPMLAAIAAMSSATLAGTLVGHRGYAILLAAAVSAAIYGILTIRDAGLSWVGQQASVALFVASAYPSSPRPALIRAGLIILGGVVQVLITSLGLRLMPELSKDLLAIPRSLFTTLREQRRELLHRLHDLPQALPAPDRSTALTYALRLSLTVTLASLLYRHFRVQSGYWVPMTALLVQKPAFFETLARALNRVLGTFAGAVLATLLLTHAQPTPAFAPFVPWFLAAATTLCAFACYATNGVNYGLFVAYMTAYIVFLLALNQIPAPVIAERRALATTAGAALALLIHLDALRRHRQNPVTT